MTETREARCPTCHRRDIPLDKHKWPDTYRWWMVLAGFQVPCLEMQITPLCLEVAFGFSREKVAIALGPVRLALWFRAGKWTHGAEHYDAFHA